MPCPLALCSCKAALKAEEVAPATPCQCLCHDEAWDKEYAILFPMEAFHHEIG